jgi:ABC-2 type transport system permease protein
MSSPGSPRSSPAAIADPGAMTFVAGRIAGTHISLGLVVAGAIRVWPLALFFAGVSALASGLLHSSRTVSGAALGALVAMYALDLAGRLARGLEPLRWISAFRYYGAPLRDGIDPGSFIGLTGAGILLLIAGVLLLERRDILH